MGDFYLAAKRNVNKVGTNVIDENFKVVGIRVDSLEETANNTYKIKIEKTNNFPPKKDDTVVIQYGQAKAYCFVYDDAVENNGNWELSVDIVKMCHTCSSTGFINAANSDALYFFNLSELSRGSFFYKNKINTMGTAATPYNLLKIYKKNDIVVDYDITNDAILYYKNILASENSLLQKTENVVLTNGSVFRYKTCEDSTPNECYVYDRTFITTNTRTDGTRQITSPGEAKNADGNTVPIPPDFIYYENIKVLGDKLIPMDVSTLGSDLSDTIEGIIPDKFYLLKYNNNVIVFPVWSNYLKYAPVRHNDNLFFLHVNADFLPTSDFWTKLDTTMPIGQPANYDKIYDEYTNSYMEVKTSDYTEMSVACEFDFIALRGLHIGGFKFEILDDAGTVVETKTIEVNLNDTHTFEEVLNCEDCNLQPCTTDRKVNWGYNLSKTYDKAHKVKFTFLTDGYVGAVFVGKNRKLPCLGVDSMPRFKGYVSDKENEITQTLTTAPSETAKRETPLTLHFESTETCFEWFEYLLSTSKELKYFNSSSVEGYQLMSHGGFIRDMQVKDKGYSLQATIKEYNNA
jgi:hypothetical protein